MELLFLETSNQKGKALKNYSQKVVLTGTLILLYALKKCKAPVRNGYSTPDQQVSVYSMCESAPNSLKADRNELILCREFTF